MQTTTITMTNKKESAISIAAILFASENGRAVANNSISDRVGATQEPQRYSFTSPVEFPEHGMYSVGVCGSWNKFHDSCRASGLVGRLN